MLTDRFSAFFVACALVVIALLSVKSQVRGGETYTQAAEGARQARELDARLDGAVLDAESGGTIDYDSLTVNLREIGRIQRALEAADAERHELTPQIAAMAALVREKSRLVEEFKSSNSLMRNSLNYVPLAARRLASPQGGVMISDTLRGQVAALIGDVLDCHVHCSPASVKLLHDDMRVLDEARAGLTEAQSERISILLRHARIVADAAPIRERAVRELLDDGDAPFDDLFVAARERREAAIEVANQYRAALVVLSVALLISIGIMVIRLRASAARLKGAFVAVNAKQSELEAFNQTLEARVDKRTKELLGSREQYRVLLETTQAVPWESLPGQRQLAYVGPQAAELLGFSISDWLTDGFLERALHPDDGEKADAFFRTLETDGANGVTELRYMTSTGKTKWMSVSAGSSFHRDGIVRRGILVDVTAQRTLEAELRSAQKLESVGRLAAGVAHEINTPVQFVSDSVQFIARSFDELGPLFRNLRRMLFAANANDIEALVAEGRQLDEKADTDYLLDEVPSALESSLEGLTRISGIVKALKEFSYPDRTEKSAVDLNANVRSTLVIAANEYKHVAEVVTILGDIPPVICHAGEINQVLLNLVVNASHAIADVVITTGQRGKIEVRTWRDDRSVFIRVGDSGAGVPDEIREKIFEPFFTTKAVGQGTGQGLAIAWNIVVEKHGGELTLESEAGQGTAFVLRLPLTPGALLAA